MIVYIIYSSSVLLVKYKCGMACSVGLTALALMVTGIRDLTLYVLINIMHCLVFMPQHNALYMSAANVVYV